MTLWVHFDVAQITRTTNILLKQKNQLSSLCNWKIRNVEDMMKFPPFSPQIIMNAILGKEHLPHMPFGDIQTEPIIEYQRETNICTRKRVHESSFWLNCKILKGT